MRRATAPNPSAPNVRRADAPCVIAPEPVPVLSTPHHHEHTFPERKKEGGRLTVQVRAAKTQGVTQQKWQTSSLSRSQTRCSMQS